MSTLMPNWIAAEEIAPALSGRIASHSIARHARRHRFRRDLGISKKFGTRFGRPQWVIKEGNRKPVP
jgi:hypothetical protein